MVPFQPKKYLSGKHVQTVYNVLFPPKNNLRTQHFCEDIYLPLKDGSSDILVLEHNPPSSWVDSTRTKPFNGWYLVLIHGMEGSSESHYMVSTAKNALERGYGVVRMNLRTCGRGWGYANLPYNSGMTQDLEKVLQYIEKYLCKNIVVSGFSLSANLVLKYFGEKRRHIAKYFSAVSPPLDLRKTCEYIDSRKAKIYREHFLETLRAKVRSGIFPLSIEKKEKAEKAKTFFDFDDYVTAPLSGFKGALDYYQKCSSLNYLKNIQTEGLVIHAEDDPVVPSNVWREIPWHRYPKIHTILTQKGGHVGFITEDSQQIPEGRWLSRILLDFFDSKIHTKKGKNK